MKSIQNNIDTTYFKKGFKMLCGVDEAGRGPWAGPVYCAAVILPENHSIQYLNDSKQLSESQRNSLYIEIKKQALSYSIVSITPKVIDNINILEASKKGMQKAVKNLAMSPDILLIDATNINIREIPQINLVHGDARSESIAAASILAKVERDRYMEKISKKYPQYAFEKHKGYGTKKHQDALKKYGATPIHRMSFQPLKNLSKK